ncbi:MAG: carbon storage regulator [Gammaproteobacteria bacterium]|nr:carbon storage regulator [Gammaproteobacteria bacterium]
MLVFTRNQHESIVIDGNIKITVLNAPRGQVLLEIEAPDDVEILNEEIYKEIQEPELIAD